MTSPPPPPGMVSTTSHIPAPTPDPRTRAGSLAPERPADEPKHPPTIDETQGAHEVVETISVDPLLDRLRAAAKWYVTALGVIVFPGHYPDTLSPCGCSCDKAACDSPAKHTPHRWTNLRSQCRTEADVDEAWRVQPWNIFVMVGPNAGLLVVDVDPRAGGTESFEKLKTNLAGIVNFDETYHYSTSEGGHHYYFKISVDDKETWTLIRRIPVNMMKGIDFKVAPGYVVAAPSRHISGAIYTRPKTSPLVVTELDRTTAAKIVANYRGAKPSTRTASSLPSSWTDLVASDADFREDLGVAHGGTVGYSELVAQIVDGKSGAVARLVAYVRVHDKLPDGEQKLTDGRNNVLSVLFRRAAEVYYAGKDSYDIKLLLEQHGLRNATSDSEVFSMPVPEEFRRLCAKIDDAICDPPYRESASDTRTSEQYRRKYHRLMVTGLIKALYQDEEGW